MRTEKSITVLRWLAALLLLLWAACPRAKASERWINGNIPDNWDVTMSADANYLNDDATTPQWWRVFNDPVLDTLVTLGLEHNYDVAMAVKRMEIAKNQVGQAQSGYMPSVGVSAAWNKARTSGATTKTVMPAGMASYFDASANLNWEIDVFGKVTAQVKQAKSQVKVSAAEFAGVMLSVEAQIASTYINLLVYRGQLAVAREHTQSQEHVLDLTRNRYEAGLASKLDVAQASTLYYSTIAQIPLLESQIDAAVNSLAVLLGTTREGLPQGVFAPSPLPSFEQVVGMGVPLDLLRRRPDVVQAEKAIEASAASLGIAKKDYLPSLAISASVGTQAHKAGNLFTNNSFTYAVAPTLSWTVFDGLSRSHNVASAKEQMQISVDNYNLTVLSAIEEVRDAARRYGCTIEYISNVEEVVRSSAEEVKLSVDLYKEGLTAFSNVVDAMLNYLSYQNTLVSARGQAISSLITLYKALGGGY